MQRVGAGQHQSVLNIVRVPGSTAHRSRTTKAQGKRQGSSQLQSVPTAATTNTTERMEAKQAASNRAVTPADKITPLGAAYHALLWRINRHNMDGEMACCVTENKTTQPSSSSPTGLTHCRA